MLCMLDSITMELYRSECRRLNAGTAWPSVSGFAVLGSCLSCLDPFILSGVFVNYMLLTCRGRRGLHPAGSTGLQRPLSVPHRKPNITMSVE